MEPLSFHGGIGDAADGAGARTTPDEVRGCAWRGAPWRVGPAGGRGGSGCGRAGAPAAGGIVSRRRARRVFMIAGRGACRRAAVDDVERILSPFDATGFHDETFPRETDAEARRAAELRLSASEAAGAWPCAGGSSARRASAQARAGRCARRLGRRGRFARCPRTAEAGGKADKGYPAQAGGAPALGAHVRDVATAASAGTAVLRGRGHGVGEPLSARCARAGAQCALRGGGGGVRLRALRGCARVTCCASKRIAWRGTTTRCATSARRWRSRRTAIETATSSRRCGCASIPMERWRCSPARVFEIGITG